MPKTQVLSKVLVFWVGEKAQRLRALAICVAGCPRTWYIEEVGLELTEISVGFFFSIFGFLRKGFFVVQVLLETRRDHWIPWNWS